MQIAQIDGRLPIQFFGGVVLASVVLMLGLTYGVEKDLTLAPRFIFFYFPAAIVLIGASLAVFVPPKFEWRSQSDSSGGSPLQNLKNLPKMTPILIVLFMAAIGSLTVAGNWGYLQTHRSDRMANLIYETSEAPVLIATTHRHHGHTGRMMGLAWEFHQLKFLKPGWTRPPQFLLAHKNDDPETIDNPRTMLKQVVAQSSRPIDVWAVNFNSQIDLAGQKCDRDENIDVAVSEYRYKLYHCFSK